MWLLRLIISVLNNFNLSLFHVRYTKCKTFHNRARYLTYAIVFRLFYIDFTPYAPRINTLKEILTLKSNLFWRFESTICFVVESIRIRIDSTRKSRWISFYIELNSIFELNQLKFLLIKLRNTLLIQIFNKGWILVSNFFQCTTIPLAKYCIIPDGVSVEVSVVSISIYNRFIPYSHNIRIPFVMYSYIPVCHLLPGMHIVWYYV